MNSLKMDSYFKSVNIIIQEKNLGPNQNAMYLINLVSKDYDRFIFTEDDNVLASNSLIFINKSLEEYYNDSDVVAVCAHNPYGLETGAEKIVLYPFYLPYVIGFWVNKLEEMNCWTNSYNLDRLSRNVSNMLRFRYFNPGSFNNFVSGYVIDKSNRTYSYEDGTPTPIDVYRDLYMFALGKKAVFPSKNLVFNAGRDGSGVNSKLGDKQSPNIYGEEVDYRDLGVAKVNLSPVRYKVPKGLYRKLRDRKPLLLYLIWRLKVLVCWTKGDLH